MDLIFIAVALVIITDVSGFWDSVEGGLRKWLKSPVRLPKILTCSFCQTHWAGLLYLIIELQWSFMNYAILLGICVLTPLIGNVIFNVKEIIGWIINLPIDIYEKFYKGRN